MNCKDCGKPIHEYELHGTSSWGHDSLNDALVCPGTENIQPQFPEPGMFGTLTEDERLALNLKLGKWAHELHVVGHTIAQVAFANREYDGLLWDYREQYAATRAELVELRRELVA